MPITETPYDADSLDKKYNEMIEKMKAQTKSDA